MIIIIMADWGKQKRVASQSWTATNISFFINVTLLLKRLKQP